MKTGADLEEGADPAPHDDLPFGRVGDPGEDLKQRALAGAVPPDDAEDLTALDLEVDLLERPEGLLGRSQTAEGPYWMPEAVHDALRERLVSLVHPYLVLL